MKLSDNIKMLNIITGLCLFVLSLVVYQVVKFDYDEYKVFLDQGAGRNENSTPRSFILPATPAIAREQEKRKAVLSRADEIKRCILALGSKGYAIQYTLKDLLNIHIKVALIEYQRENNLEVTAEFDTVTKQKLECNYQN